VKGEVSMTVVLVLVVGLITVAIATGFASQTAGGAEDKLNDTSSGDINGSVENASCEIKCTENHPSQGSNYYSCLQGC